MNDEVEDDLKKKTANQNIGSQNIDYPSDQRTAGILKCNTKFYFTVKYEEPHPEFS